MAIGHLSIRSHTRSAGHSVAAGLAYRFRTTLVDSRTGATHDYDRPNDQAAASGFAYGETQPSWKQDDPQAWADAIESAERRKNSIVARDIDIALPHELTAAQRTELARTWASHVAHAYDVPVAWAVHAPSAYSDDRNHHAHFYVGTRALDPETGLPGKKLREFSLDGSSHTVTKLRHEWQTVCNDALDAAKAAAQPVPQNPAAATLATHQYGDVAIDLRPLAEALEAERRARARMASQPDAAPISMGAFARHDGYQVIDRDRGQPVTSWRMRRVGDQFHFDRTTTRRERVACVVENRTHGYDAPHLTPTAIALERHARDVRDGDAAPGSAPARSDRTPTRGRQSVAELLEDGEPVTDRGRRGRRSLEERRAARKRRRRRHAAAQALRETEPLSVDVTIPAAPTRPEPITPARIPEPPDARTPEMPTPHVAQALRQKLAAELSLAAAIPDPEIAALERERIEQAHEREWQYATAQHARPDPRRREVPTASEIPPPPPARALPAIEGEHEHAGAQRRGRRSLEERRANRKRRRRRGMPTAPVRPAPVMLARIPGPSTTAVLDIHAQMPIPHPVTVPGFVGVQREQTRTVDYRRRGDPRGAVAFRDHGNRITVQSHRDPDALLAALRVARARSSGRPVRVRGSAAFRARVLRIAATHGIPAVDAGRATTLPRAPEPDAPARAATLPAAPARTQNVKTRQVTSLPRAPEPAPSGQATTLSAIDNKSLALADLRRLLAAITARIARLLTPSAQEELHQARAWLTRQGRAGQRGAGIPTVADSIARQRLTGSPVLGEFHPERHSKRPPLPTAINELEPRAGGGFPGDRSGPIPDLWNTGACRTRAGAELAANVLERAIDDIACQHFDGHTDPRDYKPGWFKRSVEEAKDTAMEAWEAIREMTVDDMVTAAVEPEAAEIRRRKQRKNLDAQARLRAAQQARERSAAVTKQPTRPGGERSR